MFFLVIIVNKYFFSFKKMNVNLSEMYARK